MSINQFIEEAKSKQKLQDVAEIPGWFNFHDLYDRMVSEANNGSVFIEIGVFLGRSTAYMANQIKKSGKNIKFWVIDPFDPDLLDDSKLKEVLPKKSFFSLFWKFMNDLELTDYISPLIMTSEQAQNHLRHIQADFIMIDGLHDRASVQNDIQLWNPILKMGGVIAGDDYEWPEVKEVVHTLFGKENIEISKTNWPCWIYQKSHNLIH